MKQGENRQFIANRITEYREKAGLSSEQLAKKLGITKTAVYGWELYKWTPEQNRIDQMCEMFGCDNPELSYIPSKKERMEILARLEERKKEWDERKNEIHSEKNIKAKMRVLKKQLKEAKKRLDITKDKE